MDPMDPTELAIAEKIADANLCSRLRPTQLANWKQNRQFVEFAHGRTYRFHRGSLIEATITAEEYNRLFWAQEEYASKIGLVITLVCYPSCSCPLADETLINLLLLRYDPDRLWTTSCIMGAGAGRTKNLCSCIDDECIICFKSQRRMPPQTTMQVNTINAYTTAMTITLT